MSRPTRLANQRAKLADQLLQILGLELGILGDAARALLMIEQFLEGIGIVLVLRLQLEHDVAIHLAEAPIRIPREALVAAVVHEAVDGFVGQPEVEHGVHHAGHRDARARADREQQRLFRIAEFAPERFLDARDAFLHALGRPFGYLFPWS